MKILVTGNLGYIGTRATSYLRSLGHSVLGLDCGFYEDCLLGPVDKNIKTIRKDIRDIESIDLQDCDSVVHLAALSNDPVGELDDELTFDINYKAAVRSAEIAKNAGVNRFIFISTQSIYGISNTNEELDENNSIKSPKTAYAKSKWLAEQEILSMTTENFLTVAIRPSTVFGWSSRLRSDIVFNNLLLSGLVNKKIEVHSDGSPWRPVVHIEDLVRSIELCIVGEHGKLTGKAFNIGMQGGNYTVAQIADAARECLGDVPITFNTENVVDPRSYKVSFDRANSELSFKSTMDLVSGGKEIIENLRGATSDDLLSRRTNRLQQLKYLVREGIVDAKLRIVI